MRVDAFVNQRHAGCVADQAECGSLDYSDIHGDAPFDGQAEPELWLAAKGTTGTTNLAVTYPVHCTECATECLGRPVTVPNCNVEQIFVAGQIGRGDSHPT